MNSNILGFFFFLIFLGFGKDDPLPTDINVTQEPNSDDKYGWELVWADEFNYDGDVDADKWNHQIIPIMGSNWANNEQQHYTDRIANSYVSDGTLKIVSKKEQYTFQGNTKSYTSARLNTKYVFQYGRIDISAKLPSEQGTWPAFWTLGANINEVGNYHGNTYGSVGWPACGEIDIMEQNGWDKNNLIGHLHWGNTQTTQYQNEGGTKGIQNATTAFNLYSLEWTKNEIRILFNNEVFFHKPIDNSMPYRFPHYVLFNIAMGGNLGGTIPPNFTQAAMEVDYIRIYQ
jgi:beta-glucanase (GH16 family)